MDKPSATWKDAQAKLSKTDQIMLTQMAKMTKEQKEKSAAFHKNDWKSSNKAWKDLAKGKTKAQQAKIERQQKAAQLKMVFGKSALTDKQYRKIDKYLKQLVAEGENFGQYWGY